MKAYLPELSMSRCKNCCVSRHLHSFKRVRLSAALRNLKRAGKKALRAQMQRDLRQEVL